jgi:hypothetical protein
LNLIGLQVEWGMRGTKDYPVWLKKSLNLCHQNQKCRLDNDQVPGTLVAHLPVHFDFHKKRKAGKGSSLPGEPCI